MVPQGFATLVDPDTFSFHALKKVPGTLKRKSASAR
jgi:hypothetical protein